LVAAFVGGACTAGQGVYFEKASKGQGNQSVYAQTFLFAFFGFFANASIVSVQHVAALMQPAATSQDIFHGFDSRTIYAIVGIALADLSMAACFKYLDANTYTFCRVLATWLQGILTISGLLGGGSQEVTLQFVAGSILVTGASILFKFQSKR